MQKRSLIAGVIAVLALTGYYLAYPNNHADASENPVGQSILYVAAARYDVLGWMQGGERFPEGAQLIIQDDTGPHPLLPSFASTADPDVNLNGTSILFAGKQKIGDPWQIFELTLAGRKVRRITDPTEDCIRPLYLPDGLIVFAHKRGGRFVLETLPLAGGSPTQLSFAPGSFLPDDVLQDGRILFTSGYPLGTGNIPELYTVYTDGSGVESYRCDHGRARFAGKQLSDGDILFVKSSGLARFTSAMAHESRLATPAGDFGGGIAELSDKTWLLSWRPGPGLPYTLKCGTRGSAAMTTVAAKSGMNLVQPARIAARAVPNRHPSGLHPWTYSNLLMLNASINREHAIDGRLIARVRLSTLGDDGEPRALGTAPVEKDGSFFIQVPGDRPLRFELLNTDGKVMEREQGWMWARGGEQRICVGCHAGPERAPDNAVPAVLLRTTDPTILAGTVTNAAKNGGR